MADYLVLCMEKQEKREKKILTENRGISENSIGKMLQMVKIQQWSRHLLPHHIHQGGMF